MVVGRMPWAAVSIVAAVAVAALAGCGPSPIAPGVTTVDTVPAYTPYTGTLTNTFGVVNFFAATELEVGDIDATNPNVTERGVVTFFVQNLEADSLVQSAVVRLDQCFVSGAPFNSLGKIVLERLFPIGMPPAGYQYTGVGSPPVDTITATPDTGFVTATVTSAVTQDLADSAAFSQFRLRFTAADGNNNGISDFVDFRSTPQAQTGHCASNTAGQPILIITYKTN